MRCFLFLFIFFEPISGIYAQGLKYFPLDEKSKTGLPSFEIKWYSEQLSAMNEPVIFNGTSKNEIYRFTWLRTFHHPIAIRFEKHNNCYLLFWKECSGAGGYEPGKLILDKRKVTSKSNWDDFQLHLKEIDFWNLATSKKMMGNDGAEWILEGKTKDKYHIVDRWTPNSSTSFYKCCDFLIALTGLKIRGDAKY